MELDITIQYKKLYFDDLNFIFNSIKNATKKFYDQKEIWYNPKIKNYLLSEKIIKDETDYEESVQALKESLKKGLTYEIIEISQGSLRLKCGLAVSGIISANLAPSVEIKISIEILTAIAIILYDEYETEYDKIFENLKKRILKKVKHGDNLRGINYQLNIKK